MESNLTSRRSTVPVTGVDTGFSDFPIDSMMFSNFSLIDFWRVQSNTEFSRNWFGKVSMGVLITSFTIMTLFGTLGNSLMVYIIVRRKNARSNRNIFILNLAVSDIMTCVMCIPFTVVRLIKKNWPFGELMCKIVPSLQTLYVFVSTFTIVLIAIDRYRAIVHCTSNRKNRSRLVYIFPMLWMLSMALALPMFVYHEVEDVTIDSIFLFSSCRENWIFDVARRSYASLVLIIHFLVPLVVLVTLHILICRFIRTHIESKPSYSRELHRSRRKLLRQRKNIILLTSIAVSFAVVWLPLTLTNLIADINYQIFSYIDFNWLITVCHFLAWSSVCINPVIYGWFNSNFRREIKAMLCWQKFEKDNSLLLAGMTKFKSSRFRDRLSIRTLTYVPTKTTYVPTKTEIPTVLGD